MNESFPSPEFEELVRKAVTGPDANPEFARRLRNELLRRPVQKKPAFILRPAWAIVLILLALVLLATRPMVATALKQLFGYVRGIGLVENATGMRVLAEPVSVTREGVTLTISQTLVYSDHVELVYGVTGIQPEDQFAPQNAGEENAFCGAGGPVEGDADLHLPDGTILHRNQMDLFAQQPTYSASIPPDVNELTLTIKCIPWTRLEAVPENWEIPLQLVPAPAGTAVGEPVIDVTPSNLAYAQDMGISIQLEKVVPQDDTFSFFFSIQSDKQEESRLALYPYSVTLADNQGQKIPLIFMQPWQPYDTVELWELKPTTKPAGGPYTILIDKIWAYYDPKGATFTFDPGQDPQMGQTWALDESWTIEGHGLKVVSARMVEKPEYGDGAAITNPQGFEFKFQALDGKTPFGVRVGDYQAAHNFYTDFNDTLPSPDFAAGVLYPQTDLPTDPIQVTINWVSVEVAGSWKLQWDPLAK